MKAVAVVPGKPNSMHLADLPESSVDDVPSGCGVLVEVLRVGVDGTDKINQAELGAAPEGYDFLVTGHESLGRVLEVGPNVHELSPGDYVVATVRRPGNSIYDRIGTYDMTTDETYYERGINLLHGFLTERYVDNSEYIVKVPNALAESGVLLEPVSIVEKGVEQAYEIQRRLGVWRPKRAAVVGAGPLGLLATNSGASTARSGGDGAGPHRATHLGQRVGRGSGGALREHACATACGSLRELRSVRHRLRGDGGEQRGRRGHGGFGQERRSGAHRHQWRG